MKIISYEEIENIIGKNGLKKFQAWMRGQTVPDGGHVYLQDFDYWVSYYKKGKIPPIWD